MKRRFIIILITILVIVSTNIIMFNRSATPPITTKTLLSLPMTLRGVAVSPQSYTGGDFSAFFTKAKQAGDVITGQATGPDCPTPKVVPMWLQILLS